MKDRDLVRLYWPVELRPAFDALFAIDDAMADVVVKASDPTLAAIKLAWWRDRLEGLDQGQVPAEPRLQAASKELLPRAISGALISGLQEGWAELLQQNPEPERVLERGARLFRIARKLLWPSPAPVLDAAGRLYAAGQLQRLGLGVQGAFVITEITGIPKAYRALSVLAALARRDLHRAEPEATPARAFTLLRHRLTGRIG